jgi:hypothetical protein
MLIGYFLINWWVLATDEVTYYHQLNTSSLLLARADYAIVYFFTGLGLTFPITRKYFQSSIQFPKAIKYTINLLILLTSWFYITYDYNFFADSWHLSDRILILLISLLSLRFPSLTILLVAHIFLMDYQFNFPLGGSKMLDKLLVLELLKIWGIFHFLEILVRVFNVKIKAIPDYLYISLLWVYGFFYFYAGYQKALLSKGISWIYDNEILYNLLAIKDKGWLNNMPQWIQDFQYSYFEHLGTFGQAIILAFELGVGCILINKRFLPLFVFSAIFLHSQVFILNGALFWLWIGAGILIYQIYKQINNSFFSFRIGVVGLLIMIFIAPLGIKIPKLAWYDSPLDNYFELEVKLNSGKQEKISLGSIQPYTLHFQYGNILSTIKSKNIYPGFLIVDKNTFKQVKSIDAENLMNFIEKHGENHYSKPMEENLDNLLKAYLHQGEETLRINSYLKWIQPPEYWNAHLTDNLQTVEPKDIQSIMLFHSSKYRYLDKDDIVLWRRLVKQIEKNK